MRKLFATIAILGCLACAAPLASAQTQCYRDHWGNVTCVRTLNGVRYWRDADNWRWHRHYRDRDRDRDRDDHGRHRDRDDYRR